MNQVQQDCLAKIFSSDMQYNYIQLPPGMGKSIIIYHLIKTLGQQNVYLKTEKHLIYQLQKQLNYYARNDSPVSGDIFDNIHGKYLIIDEYKPTEQLRKGYEKYYLLNCYFPKEITPIFSYSIDQAIQEGYLTQYQTKQIKSLDEISENKCLIISNSDKLNKLIKQHKINRFQPNNRYQFQNSDNKFMYITLSQIEGLSLPFLSAIVYNDTKLNEYQKIQILGRIIRKDKSDPNKKATIYIMNE